jgi:TMEM164 family
MMISILKVCGDWLREKAVHVGDYNEGDDLPPEEGVWYLSAEQHVFEFLLYLLFYGYVVWTSLPTLAHSSTLRDASSDLLGVERRKSLQHFDRFLGLLGVACFAVTVALKLSKPHPVFQLHYLLQPCHVLTVMFVMLCWLPSSSRVAHMVYNAYSCCFVSTVFALASPDLRGRPPLEILHFWLLHWLLLVLPFYMEATRKFVLRPGNIFAHFSIMSLYHFAFLCPVTLAVGGNMNYLLQPPNVPILIDIGAYYRIAMQAVTLVLCTLTHLSVRLFSHVLYMLRPHSQKQKDAANKLKSS